MTESWGILKSQPIPLSRRKVDSTTPIYKRFDIIYAPDEGSPTREYSYWSANLVKSNRYDTMRTCSHACKYCYNGAGKENLLPGPTLKDNLFDRLRKDLPKVKAAIEHNNRCKPDEPTERLLLTFVGDLYDPELPEGTARRILQMVRAEKVPLKVLTKGGMRAVQDFDLYSPNDMFGATLTFDNPEDSKKWEPNAALPEDRIGASKAAHDLGIRTWASLEPVLDPAQSLHLIDITHEFVDQYGVGKLNHDPVGERLIHWRMYRAEAEAKLNGYGKSYKIKEALAKAMT